VLAVAVPAGRSPVRDGAPPSRMVEVSSASSVLSGTAAATLGEQLVSSDTLASLHDSSHDSITTQESGATVRRYDPGIRNEIDELYAKIDTLEAMQDDDIYADEPMSLADWNAIEAAIEDAEERIAALEIYL